MLNAPRPEQSNKELAPKGVHVARLYRIIHIGTNRKEWQGKTKDVDEISFTFELCNEKKVFKDGEEEKPFVLSRTFTFSMGSKANLRSFVEGLIGTTLMDDEAYAFDVEELLGQACMLNVVHTTKQDGHTYVNIFSATQLPRGMEAPEQVNPSELIDVKTASKEEIERLPKFIAEKMFSSAEWRKRTGSQKPLDYPEDEINPDDIPF